MTERQMFEAALEQPPEGRCAYLDAICGSDLGLRRRLEALMMKNDLAGSFLESPAAVLTAAPDDLVRECPGTVIGPYKLLEQIGEGGFGVVFMAEQQQPVRRMVALKVVKPGMDTRQVVARFEAERQALALMDHPNIAKVLDAGTVGEARDEGRGASEGPGVLARLSPPGSRPYFVMELVRGVAVTDFCDQNHLPVRQRLDLFVAICQAVQHAHQKGIIHRDLKPSNVLVTLHDGTPVAKVIDFGIAKALGQKLTEKTLFTNFAQMVGTPLYMSPEQAEMSGLDIDTRTDVYALGVLLYELLTGTTPFDRERLRTVGFDELRRIIREEEPAKPSARISTVGAAAATVSSNRQSNPGRLSRVLRGDLDWIVMKCLEKDRTRRYDTASGLARDIQRYLYEEPVEACPPSAIYRLRKFARKNRRLLATMAAFVLLLLMGAGVSAGLAIRATLAEQQAQNNERQALAERDEKEQARQAEADQRRQAVAEKQRADEQAAIAQAVNDFLQKDLLGQADVRNQPFGPDQPEPNPKITVRELLDRAEKAVAGKFVHQPLVEAAVRQTLADTYRGLGEDILALPHAQRALALRTASLGPDHDDTLQSMNNLAVTYHTAGKTAEAIDLLERLRDATVKKHGAGHRYALITLANLAVAYRAAGKTTEAIALLEHVRDVRMKQLEPDHADTLSTLYSLATAYQAAGRRTEAIALLEHVRDERVKKLGADNPDTLGTLNALARAYQTAGKTTEAIALYEKVRKAQAKLGADPPATIAPTNDLAMAYWAAGMLAEAIAMLEEARDASAKKRGGDHPFTLTILDNLAGAYRAAGKTTEAIALHEKVLDARLKKLGPDHLDTLTTLNNLAVAHHAAGKLDRALPLYQQAAAGAEKRKFADEYAAQIVANLSNCHEQLKQYEQAEGWRRKWLAVVKEKTGHESLAYAGELAGLGLMLLKQKKWTDAEPVVRDCLIIRQKKEPDSWRTFNTQSMLGGALLGQKKFADAEPLLLHGYQGMKEREAKIPKEGKARLTEALERLVQLYDAWGKKAEADRWRKESEADKARQRK